MFQRSYVHDDGHPHHDLVLFLRQKYVHDVFLLIVLLFYESEFAQPANIFFGHLLGIIIGILFNEFIGMSYMSLGLAVGSTVTLMMYFKIIHPPAAANPLIALFADVSLDYIVFPVMVGTIVIIILSVIINKFLLKRNYPIRWF